MSTWLAKNPADMGVRVEYANILMQQQSNALAIAQFQTVLKQDPNNVVALNNLGWMLQTSDPKRALSMLTLAQKIAPNSPDIADTLGWVKVQQKDVAGGLALLNKAHAASPQDGEITYHLAVALDASGQRGPARQLLKTLLASGTKFTDLPAANKLAADWR
jgi:Tfp pilus assembly protein PilF